MSEGDFEVMPRGTIEEVRVMRKFANELVTLTEVQSGNKKHLLNNLLSKIVEIEEFCKMHVAKYPSNG